MANRYVAYTGSYSYKGSAKGIAIFDIEENIFTKRTEIHVDNASYLAVSHSGGFLYSISDQGVISFRILPNGNLEQLNCISIQGMRGCHIEISKNDKFLVISGYHDGKVTILPITKSGALDNISDERFHKGFGSVSDRSFRPRVSCSTFTPEEHFLCSVSINVDQIIIYKFDKHSGKINICDILRCPINSGPRYMRFSSDGKFMYLLSELSNTISVYKYTYSEKHPNFEHIQTITTLTKDHGEASSACYMIFDSDNSHIICSNAGDNSITIYNRNSSTGMLSILNTLPISGTYPKTISLLPDDKHLVSVNNISSELTFFNIDYDNGLVYMYAKPQPVNEPNSCVIVKL
jgi:3-carboxymuconate cyclase